MSNCCLFVEVPVGNQTELRVGLMGSDGIIRLGALVSSAVYRVFLVQNGKGGFSAQIGDTIYVPNRGTPKALIRPGAWRCRRVLNFNTREPLAPETTTFEEAKLVAEAKSLPVKTLTTQPVVTPPPIKTVEPSASPSVAEPVMMRAPREVEITGAAIGELRFVGIIPDNGRPRKRSRKAGPIEERVLVNACA